jgi:hypothetical protein
MNRRGFFGIGLVALLPFSFLKGKKKQEEGVFEIFSEGFSYFKNGSFVDRDLGGWVGLYYGKILGRSVSVRQYDLGEGVPKLNIIDCSRGDNLGDDGFRLKGRKAGLSIPVTKGENFLRRAFSYLTDEEFESYRNRSKWKGGTYRSKGDT